MKKLSTFLAIAMICTGVFAQKASWFSIPTLADTLSDPRTEVYEIKNLYEVVKVTNFDIVSQGYDDLWDKIPTSGVITHQDFNLRTHSDDADFSAEFKAAYDEFYLYVLANVNDNEIHETAISDVYDGDDDDGNPTFTTKADGVEFMWSTYPVMYQRAFDSGYVEASVCRWDTTGSYKTGWTLASSPDVSIVYDDYRPTWDFEAFAPSETPWAVGWGSTFGDRGCIAKFNKISESNYTYFAAIPFETAMAGFAPAAEDSITMEIKFDDVDESTKDQGVATATYNSASNDVYQAMWYAGLFEFTDTEVFPVSTPSISKSAELSFFPNPASDYITVQADGIKQVDVLNIVGQKVLSFDYNNVSEVNLNVSDLSNGVYFISVNRSQTVRFIKK